MAHAIEITLLSETVPSRGDGTAGEVDIEVLHDELGLPYLSGRTVVGLLRDSWLSMAEAFPELAVPAQDVLGEEGLAGPVSLRRIRVGDASVAAKVVDWIRWAVHRDEHPVDPGDVLRALTEVRRQTARDEETGAPARGTLRAQRVLLPGLRLEAPLEAPGLGEDHWQALARACLGVRHMGTSRNRGKGWIRVALLDGGLDVTGERAGLR